ncbi:hypothetical protein BN14_06584 [Rhizoctonia solani AG-1 IB]|uniref:Uncharacterized protein n=1 Tax=Thanatephorus cucumeris (strain AG1-IB / isolate 7/3/14) TaxID=1108050 RepID=M5BY02_THACB|nr:hypothetical protein BN14_06584 [Rhizoctonia solani AG-1 IB]
MNVCAEVDCDRKNIFFREALRWVKQALKDAGVVILEDPIATTALFIGLSVLLPIVLDGGILVSTTLQAIGFGVKGPIKGSIAAAIQSKISPVQLGSFFSQLQSAAMGGATTRRLEDMANTLVHSILLAGTATLLRGSIKTIGEPSAYSPQQWQVWESKSIFNVSGEAAIKMTQFWERTSSSECISYGYQAFHAPLWVIPEGIEPLKACLQTPNSINGFGYKVPLSCEYQGPKKGVIGTWYVPSNQTRCTPRWSVFEDEFRCFRDVYSMVAG